MAKRAHCVSRQHFVNKLRELGFRYRKGRVGRQDLWKRGTDRVVLPRNAELAVDWCRQTLRMAGVAEDEIDQFIRESNS